MSKQLRKQLSKRFFIEVEFLPHAFAVTPCFWIGFGCEWIVELDWLFFAISLNCTRNA